MHLPFAEKSGSLPDSRRWLKMSAVAVSILLAFGLFGPTAGAVEDNPMVDRWEFDIGSLFMGTDTKVRLDSTVLGVGTEIDLEDDLGFDDSGSELRLEGAYLIGHRHQLRLGYFRMPRDAATTIRFDINWGDETYPVNADVAGHFDVTFWEFGYEFWMLTRERTALGLGLSLSWAQVEAGIGLEGSEISAEDDWSTDVPVPTIFLELRQNLVHRLDLEGELGYMSLAPLSGYDGDVWKAALALEHQTWEHVGFGLRYSIDAYSVEKEEEDLLGWKLDLDIQGFQVYLHLVF